MNCPQCGATVEDKLLFMGVQEDGFVCSNCKAWVGPDGRLVASVVI